MTIRSPRSGYACARHGFVVAAGILLGFAAGGALRAEPASRASAGEVELQFNRELLRAAGVEVVAAQDGASSGGGAFASTRFRARSNGALDLVYLDGVFAGIGAGALRFDDGFVLRLAEGGEVDLRRFEIAAAAPPATFEIRTAAGEPVFLVDSLHRMHDAERVHVLFRNADARISPWLAARLGQPELAGLTVAGFDLLADFEAGAEAAGSACSVDLVSAVDVQMSSIGALSQVSRQAGVRVSMAASATLVNNGPGTVEWYRAIAPDGTVGAHPFLAQQLYRLDADGRFRQIGQSDVKHAFYAVNSGCSCSGGQLLYAGCGDTYGVSNNSDRKYFAPRGEVSTHPEAWASRWSSTGSHFDGFGAAPPNDDDNFRSHGGNEVHDGFEHLLQSAESELQVAGARFFVETWYATARDSEPWNNIGHREVVPSFNGALWTFAVLGGAVTLGPAVDAWVAAVTPPAQALSSTLATADGRLRLASRATDLLDGTYRYDYALFNLDFDRRVDRLAVPAWGGGQTSFRGTGSVPATPWGASTSGGEIVWEGAAADALDWASLYAFSFVAAAPPAAGTVTVRAVESGSPASFPAAAIVPQAPLFADDFETATTERWSDAVSQ